MVCRASKLDYLFHPHIIKRMGSFTTKFKFRLEAF